MKKRQGGWGLLDMTLTLAIAAILLGLSIPSFRAGAHHMQTMRAELKLLQWQINKKAPTHDDYFDYTSSLEGNQVIYRAKSHTQNGSNCDQVSLSSDLRPASPPCWPG